MFLIKSIESVIFTASIFLLILGEALGYKSSNKKFNFCFKADWTGLFYLDNGIIIILNWDRFSMMVYFPVLLIPESVHVGVDEHNHEGEDEVEQEPDIHHLHVGGCGQVVWNIDKHGS